MSIHENEKPQNAGPQNRRPNAQPIAELREINKRFPENNVWANRDVSLTIHAGEILALVGENGAGKSTIMHVLSGAVSPDSGTILRDGKPVRFEHPRDAIESGIMMVHQHPQFVPELQVWENLVLGIEPRGRFGAIDRTAAIEQIAELAARYHIPINPNQRVEHLSSSRLHLAAILGALLREPEILILDEPTAPCSEHEVELLFALLRSLASDGRALILITHKLREVFTVADRVTVMRHGAAVAERRIGETDVRELAGLMIGEDCQMDDEDLRLLQASIDDEREEPGGGGAGEADAAGAAGPDAARGSAGARAERCDTPLFSIRNVSLYEGHFPLLSDVSLSVCAGTVVGVTGIRENGLEYLEDVISGSVIPDSGEAVIGEKRITEFTPRRFRRLGVAYVPTDRLIRGASMDSSVQENLILLRRKRLQKRGVFDRRRLEGFSSELKDKYGIAASLKQPLRRLSGGNIQKVILSRELSTGARVVIFSEPSWGLDFRSKQFVYREIRRLRDEGAAVILISADIDEVLSMSDEIAVMFKGRIATVLRADERTREKIGEYMLGLEEQELAP